METPKKRIVPQRVLQQTLMVYRKNRAGLCPLCDKPSASETQRYCRSCANMKMRQWRREHRQNDEQRRKSNCRSYLHIYIKRGVIKKGPCVVCNTAERIEAHHPDYDKPLLVYWMCRSHHSLLTRGVISIPPGAKPAEVRWKGKPHANNQ